MELALIIIAGIGALLFLIGYLGFVVAGFKHHFVTGIISALPVLNIVTIPALWYNASKKFFLSILGIALVGGSWFMGADEGINKTIAKLKGEKVQQVVNTSNSVQSPLNINNTTGSTTIAATPSSQTSATSSNPYAAKQRYIDESNVIPLPSKALYSVRFEAIPLNNISALKGRTIQIVTKGNQLYEGQVTALSTSSIAVQSRGSVANELPIANIKQLRLMVKKAN